MAPVIAALAVNASEEVERERVPGASPQERSIRSTARAAPSESYAA